MQIRESENGVYISGVEEVEVTCVEDCLKLLAVGERNRTVAFTKMNAHSSRSHAIAIITVEKKRRKDAESSDSEAHSGPATAAAGHGSDEHRKPEKKDKILVGKLFLVDLAGSERLKKSGSEGLRASEAKSVNLSLTVLGKCINARADPHAHHVPFRDSKLTRLLQESLGGNAKTSLVINVAPTVHHLNESLSSLLFGSRAMEVKTKAMVNEEEEYRILTRTLQETIDEHDDRVHSLEVVVYSQEEQLSQAKASLEEQKELVGALQAEREEMEQKLAEGVAAVEEEWAAKLEQAETEARQQMEEAQQTFSENLSKATECLTVERDDMAKELASAREMVQRLEQQLQEAQEAKGHLEEALLVASESGDGADGPGAGLQLLMTEKAARQQAEQEVAVLRGEMSRGRVMLEETETKLAQQIEETTQRVEHLRALKAESKRLNELAGSTTLLIFLPFSLPLAVHVLFSTQETTQRTEQVRALKAESKRLNELAGSTTLLIFLPFSLPLAVHVLFSTQETTQRTEQVRALKAESKRLNELAGSTTLLIFLPFSLPLAVHVLFSTQETTQRTEQVRALKAESKRLNELVVATSRALVAGAADAAGRALSSLDYHFCAPKIKT
ncbi:unnamed protein product [Closterium sp. Naga37s-1]|nr:unnamed protein product [Closterium sp. Naga37s-1]